MKTEITLQDSIIKGQRPHIGVQAMCELFTGWKMPDGSTPPSDYTEGFHVSYYFDQNGCYLGPDENGIEPVFRNLTEEEAAAYLAPDLATGAAVYRPE